MRSTRGQLALVGRRLFSPSFERRFGRPSRSMACVWACWGWPRRGPRGRSAPTRHRALLALVLLLTALFTGGAGPSLLQVGPLRVTAAALTQGALLAARLLALGLVFFFWLSTTDQAAMVRVRGAADALHLGLTLALALRYLPILAGLLAGQRGPASARPGPGAAAVLERLAAYRPVLIAMLISALRNGERLGWALKARALGAPGVRRSVFRPLRLRRADLIALAVLGGY